MFVLSIREIEVEHHPKLKKVTNTILDALASLASAPDALEFDYTS